jgi:hypothetical protein
MQCHGVAIPVRLTIAIIGLFVVTVSLHMRRMPGVQHGEQAAPAA